MAKKELTKKQQLFVENYVGNGFNSRQAYISAGYACKGNALDPAAYQILSNIKVKKAISARVKELLSDKQGLAERWVEQICNIAFMDMRTYAEWNGRRIDLKDSDKIPDHVASVITEVSETRDGVKIKLASKEKALELLGKYLSILTDKVEHDIPKELIDTMKNIQAPWYGKKKNI